MKVAYLGLFVELLAMGAGAVPNALPGSWEPIAHADFLAQSEYRGRCLILWQLDMPSFADAHGRLVPF